MDWMEGDWHIHSLCLWRDELCGSQLYMQTGQLHVNEAHLSDNERPWGSDNEKGLSVEMFQIEPSLLPINKNASERKVNTHGWQCKVGHFCEKTVEVKSCLRYKYSAVKHISTDKAWNKQHRLSERWLKQSLKPSLHSLSSFNITGEAQNMSSKRNKNQKCAQFKVDSQKHFKNHVLCISHIRVNTQQAVAILLDLKTYVMCNILILLEIQPHVTGPTYCSPSTL